MSLNIFSAYVIIFNMKTLNVAISDVEYTKFGISNNVLTFSDFVDMVSKEIMRENMEAAVTAAHTYSLSTMDNGRNYDRSSSCTLQCTK